MPHAHGGAGENPEEIRVLADHLLKGGDPLAAITAQGAEGETAWVEFKSKVPVVRAELNYTKDAGRWQDRKWESLPATRLAERFSARLPAGTRAYYFNLVDQRDCVVSSEHREWGP
jgi:hypothetical protein